VIGYLHPVPSLIKDSIDKFESQKIKIIHVEVDKRECFDVIRELNVKACPTCLFFEKGSETGRFVPSGQTKSEVLKKLLEMNAHGPRANHFI